MVVASTLLSRTGTPSDVNDLQDPGAIFVANYETSVTLTSSYQTVDQRSRTGADQRYGLADKPRISTPASTLPINSAQVRVMNDQLIRRTKSRQPFPLYSDSFAISAGTGGAQSTTFNVDSKYNLNYRRIEAEQYLIVAPLERDSTGIGCVDNYVTRKIVSVDKSSSPQTVTLDDTLDFTSFAGSTGTGFTPPSLRDSDFQGKVTGFTASDSLTSGDVLIESGDILVVASCGVGFGGNSSTPALATVIAGSAGTTGSAPSLTMTSFGALAGGTTDADGEEFLPKCQYSRLIITDAIATYLNGMCKTNTAFTHGASHVCSIDHHTFVIKDADTSSPIQDSDTKDVAAGGQSTSTVENFAQTQDNTVEQGTSFFFPKATALQVTGDLFVGTGSTRIEVQTAGDLSGVSGIATSLGTMSGCFTSTQTTTSDITANFKTDSSGGNRAHRVQCGYLSLKPSNTQLNKLKNKEIQLRAYPAIEADASPETSLEIIHDELQSVDLVAEQTPGLNTLSNLATVAEHGRSFKAVYNYNSGGTARNVEIPIFDFQINYGGGIAAQEVADIDRVEVGLGRSSQLFGTKGSRQFEFEILALDRATAWSFIQFFQSRRGRLLPFWFPSLSTELKLSSYSGTTLVVTTEIGSAAEIVSRGHICFITKTGGRAIASITSATDNADGTTSITINKSPTDDVAGTTFDAVVTSSADISLLKFVSLCQFNSDGLTEGWVTNDICQMQVGVKELIDEKDAESNFGFDTTTALDAAFAATCDPKPCDDHILGSCTDTHCCVCASGILVDFRFAARVCPEQDVSACAGCIGCAPILLRESNGAGCCGQSFEGESGNFCSGVFLERHVTGVDGNGDDVYGFDSWLGENGETSADNCNQYVFSITGEFKSGGTYQSYTLFVFYEARNCQNNVSPFHFPDAEDSPAGTTRYHGNRQRWADLYAYMATIGPMGTGDIAPGVCIPCNVSESPDQNVCDGFSLPSADFFEVTQESNASECCYRLEGLGTLSTSRFVDCDFSSGSCEEQCPPTNDVCCGSGFGDCAGCTDSNFETVCFDAIDVTLIGYSYGGFCQGSDPTNKCVTCNPLSAPATSTDFSSGKSSRANFTTFTAI